MSRANKSTIYTCIATRTKQGAVMVDVSGQYISQPSLDRVKKEGVRKG